MTYQEFNQKIIDKASKKRAIENRKRKKFSQHVEIYCDNIKMNGDGIEKIVYSRDSNGRFNGEQVELYDFISHLQEEISEFSNHAYDISFYISADGGGYLSIGIDYDCDIVPDKDVDTINDFLFYSHINFYYA